jgi:hypothetical protein
LKNEYNALWGLLKLDNIDNISLEEFFKNNYFVHFAGHTDFDQVTRLHILL